MARKRKSFARIGTLCLVLVTALGAMGVTYGGYWSETLNIINRVETGTWNDIEIGNPFNCYTVPDPPPTTTGISCSLADSNVLKVTITNASVVPDYYCDFSIENNGTIPVRIQSIEIEVSALPAGVTANVTGTEGEDLVGVLIDPDDTKHVTVHVDLINGNSQGENFSFDVTFSAVRWNQ